MTLKIRLLLILSASFLSLSAISYGSADENQYAEQAKTGWAPPPYLEVGWGTAPRAPVYSKNLQTVISLYAWSKDRLIGLGFPGEKNQDKRLYSRLALVPFDFYVIGFITSVEHELGHIESAKTWGHDATWHAVFSWETRFGFFQSPEVADFDSMNAVDRLSFISDGVNATQSGLDDMVRREYDSPVNHWSFYASFIGRKSDVSSYILKTPRPRADDPPAYTISNSDIQDYEIAYSSLSGQSKQALYDKLILGGIFNLLDPQIPVAIYEGLVKYLVAGQEYSTTPFLPLPGQWQGMIGTNFWLARNGPQYRLNAYIRDKENKVFTQVSGTSGDLGQWTLENRWSFEGMVPSLDFRTFTAVWRQREFPQVSGMDVGAAFGGGVTYHFTHQLALTAGGGYKSWGALLGYPFNESPFFNAFLNFQL